MSKIFLNYEQQIKKLKDEKNMIVEDEVYAEEILKMLQNQRAILT